MNLYLNQASPYARLISVLLVETGLDTETESIFVDPWVSPDELLVANPGSPSAHTSASSAARPSPARFRGPEVAASGGAKCLAWAVPLMTADR